MNKSEWQEITGFLKNLEFSVKEETIQQDSGSSLSVLSIFLGSDSLKRDLYLQLTLLEMEKKRFCQCFLPFPFNCKKEVFPDLARLILLINKVSPLPGLGLSEIDQMVTFNYLFPYSRHEFFDFFPLLISKILFIYEVYQPHLENLAAGKISYEELLKQAKEHAEAL